MNTPNPDQRSSELRELLIETTSALGGSNDSYIALLKYLAQEEELRMPNAFLPGQMVFFKYKPQTERFMASTSPYDIFPLCIITDVHRDGFEGINLHFIAKKWRRELFNAIQNFLPLKKSADPTRTRLGASYDRMDVPRKFRFFRPCYRRYLKSGFRKRPIVIPSEFWDVLVDVDLSVFMRGKKVGIRRKNYFSVINSENNP